MLFLCANYDQILYAHTPYNKFMCQNILCHFDDFVLLFVYLLDFCLLLFVCLFFVCYFLVFFYLFLFVCSCFSVFFLCTFVRLLLVYLLAWFVLL